MLASTRTRIQLAPVQFEQKPRVSEQGAVGAGATQTDATQEWKKKTTLLDKIEMITAARLEKEKAERKAYGLDVEENEDNGDDEEMEEEEEEEEFESAMEYSQEEEDGMEMEETGNEQTLE